MCAPSPPPDPLRSIANIDYHVDTNRLVSHDAMGKNRAMVRTKNATCLDRFHPKGRSYGCCTP